MTEFFINDVRLPITPASLTTTKQDNTEILQTANYDPVTIMHVEGAEQIQFSFYVPTPYGAFRNHPFVRQEYPANYYENYLESLKRNKRTCVITIIRDTGITTNKEMILTSWSINEDAGNGNFWVYDLTFVAWKPATNYQLDNGYRRLLQNA